MIFCGAASATIGPGGVKLTQERSRVDSGFSSLLPAATPKPDLLQHAAVVCGCLRLVALCCPLRPSCLPLVAPPTLPPHKLTHTLKHLLSDPLSPDLRSLLHRYCAPLPASHPLHLTSCASPFVLGFCDLQVNCPPPTVHPLYLTTTAHHCRLPLAGLGRLRRGLRLEI